MPTLDGACLSLAETARPIAAGPSGVSDKQWQHVCTASHERVRRLEMLAQFSLPDE